jgi:hypothetical protein
VANNLADNFEEMADAVPGRVALVSGDERMTFKTTVVVNRFDPTTLWELSEREGVHDLTITGDAIARPLLDALGPGRTAPTAIRTVASSGGTLSPSVKAELARALPHASPPTTGPNGRPTLQRQDE